MKTNLSSIYAYMLLLIGIGSYAQDSTNLSPQDEFTYTEHTAKVGDIESSEIAESSSVATIENQTSTARANSSGIGETEGVLSVSLTGGATYTIPIAVPPGVNGVEPDIAISYNSQSGNGLAGWGWNISGLSTITRIPATKYHDGQIDGVDFDNLDRFALDGQRLIVKTGSYGANGTVYQTEKYSNLKITSYGVSSFGATFGPQYFIVNYPDGSKAYYGHTNDSRSMLEYAISYWENPQGLRINYVYTRDDNVLKISRIDYGKTASTTLVLNQIIFNYRDRTRAEHSYIAGVKFSRKKLLQSIKVSGNGIAYRNYELGHNTSSLGYDRLTGVVEKTGDNTLAHTPIKFSYFTRPFSLDYVPTTADLGVVNIAQNNSQSIPLDFTGNGKMDFIVHPNTKDKFWLFQGDNYNRPTTVNTGGRFEHIFPANHLNHQNKILEGQGFTVVQKSTNNTVRLKVYGKTGPSSGTPIGLKYEKTWGLPTYIDEFSCTIAGNSYPIPQQYISGDFNGDGLSDIIAISKPYSQSTCVERPPNPGYPCGILGLEARENTTDSLQTATSGMTKDTLTSNNSRIPIDGNCCDCETSSGRAARVTFINMDRRVTSGFAKYAGALGRAVGASDRVLTADVNGDGKTDILLFVAGRVYVYTLSKTNSLQLLWQNISSHIKADLPIFIGDYNGDGKADFMTPSANGSGLFYTFISNGYNFSVTSDTFPFKFNNSYSSGGEAYSYNLFPVDINGDGKTDIIDYAATTYNGDPARGTQTVKIYRNHYRANSNKELIFTYAGQKTNTGNLHHLPVPIFLSSDQPNYALEFATISNKYIHSFRQNSDHREEVALSSVNNNEVTHFIQYSNLDPNNNEAVYTKSTSQVYPYVDIATAPGIKLVKRITRDVDNTPDLYQDFYYHGAVSHLGGLGFSGFQKVARSNWHTSRDDRIFTNTARSINLQGAVTDEYQTPYDHRFGTIPSDYISKTNYVYEHILLPNKVFTLLTASSTNQNRLEGTSTTKNFVYGAYNLLAKETTNYSGHGSSVIESTYANSTGNDYYIGRITNKSVISTIGSNSFNTEERYAYLGSLLTTKQLKGNGTQFNTESYVYDAYGNITQTTITPYGETSRVTKAKYDPSARFVIKATDIEGLETSFTYNTHSGTLKKETDPFNLSTSYDYDQWNRITKVTDYLGNSSTTTYVESRNSYTVTSNSADGGSASSTYDPLQRKINDRAISLGGIWKQVSYEYDKFDRPYRQSEPHLGNAPSQWNTTEYDFYGRIKRQTLHTGKVITYTYNGLQVSVNDGTKTVSTTKDAMGNVVRVDDPGGTISYTHFGNGNLKSSTYGSVVQTIEQDGWGRKTKLTDPSAGVYTYTYNGYNEILEQTNPKGKTTYTYSTTGRITHEKNKGDYIDTRISYTYDTTTKLLKKINFADHRLYKTYDYEYSYDTYNRLIRLVENTTSASFRKEYTYDNYGRLIGETHLATVDGKSSYNPFYKRYDNYGAFKGFDNWEITSKNARDQVTSINLLRTNDVENLQYDAYGFLKKNTVHYIHNDRKIIENTYNFNPQRGTLSSRTHKTASLEYIESFKYDTQDRLTQINGPFPRTNDYDTYGRITNNSKIGAIAYQGANKRYQLKDITLNTNGSQFYQNRARQHINYNAFKKPVTIHEAGKGRIDFEYGIGQQRTNAYYGGLDQDKTKRRFHKIYSTIMPYEIVHDKQKGTYKFISFNGGDAYSAPMVRIQKFTNNSSEGIKLYYLQRDHLGSILNITEQVGSGVNARGKLMEHRQFGAWGTVDAFWSRTSGVTMGNESILDRGYTGHEHFEDVGLIHMNGRMYDPQLGRFLSPDNYIQNPYNTQNYNRYSYVLNNPLMYTDPSGEMTEDEGGGNGWLGTAAAASVLQSLRGARIGSFLGDAGTVLSKPARELGRWVRGWFGKAPDKIEFAQTQVMSDPLMNPNPGISSLFTMDGVTRATVAFQTGQVGIVQNIVNGVRTIVTNPTALFTKEAYLARVSTGFENAFPSLRIIRTQMNLQRAAFSGNSDVFFHTFGGQVGELQLEAASLIPAFRGARAVGGASRAAKATARARALGNSGEKAVGINGSKKTIPSLTETASFRIPDKLTDFSLIEVKNVKSLSLTRQLRDFHLFSEEKGLSFILYTRSTTKLSVPLRRLIENGYIIRRNIPGL